MVLTATAGNPVLIEGFPLSEGKVEVGELAAFTHGNFHQSADVLRESNTPEGIAKLLVAEIDELLEVLEDDRESRVDLVAELGDLLHLWNDLFQLSDASVASLLNFFQIEASTDELTVAQLKEVASQKYAEESVARNLLYELKVALRLGKDEQIDVDLIGVIAAHIFAVAVSLDVNIIYAVLMKNLRNRQKYDPVQMNQLYAEGETYDAIRLKMVKKWNNGLGGDTKFFKEFLAQFPIEWSYVVASQLAKA